MDELIKMVTAKAGINADQAQKAIDTVLGFLKDKLPAPMAGQIDALLKGDVSQLGNIAGELGGMFGKK